MNRPAVSERERARDLRSIVGDGASYSVMVGLGETYIPAFALAAGLGEVVAGLVATVPMLAGALFQLLTPWAVRHLRSYRRWVVLCACLQGLSFAPLVVGAAVGQMPLHWLAIATMCYWSFGMAISPAWNAWVTSLVPQEIRARFFAGRTRIAQTALFVSLLVAGSMLEWGRTRGTELALFACLFAGAALARMVSARFLARQSEAPGLAATHRTLPLAEVLASVRAAGSGRALAYLLGMQAAVNVAAPFFTPYMLGPLGLSYFEFMVLLAAAFVARVAVLPLIGRVAHQHGARPLLWWGAVGITPLPLLWLASGSFGYLLALQVAAGCAWAALELATLLSFFDGIEQRDRASVLSAFNLGNAAAAGLGAVASSQLFAVLDGSTAGYAWLFSLSTVGRLLMLPVLSGIAPARRVIGLRLRTLAVRPSVGALQRPILASVEPPAPAEKPPDPPAGEPEGAPSRSTRSSAARS